MANKNDLRWQRTERHLLQAMESQLGEKPLRKITVTSLAREAEISTAAFYLHYRDAYDLADAYASSLARQVVDGIPDVTPFFHDPQRFASELMEQLSKTLRSETLDIMGTNKLVARFMDDLAECLGRRLDEIGVAERTLESNIALTFLVHGMIGAVVRFQDADRDVLKKTLGIFLVRLGEGPLPE
ncbi:MAG: TetR/AcrR family transcriptional regulator [Eggerthellaceae bacterium]